MSHVEIRRFQKILRKNSILIESDVNCRFLFIYSRYETESKPSCKIYAYYK